jgi:siroheme synthase-like protein
MLNVPPQRPSHDLLEAAIPHPDRVEGEGALPPLFPIFLRLHGRRVVVVGGGPVAAAKVFGLRSAGARVTVVAPIVCPELQIEGVTVLVRDFEPKDLEGAWLVVAAAPPEVNRAVERAAEARCLFVNTVDDAEHATAFLPAVVRRGSTTLAFSTGGVAPGLARLVREALEALLPHEVGDWAELAQSLRNTWKRDRTPFSRRAPLLLQALQGLYSQGEEE